jgi:membrane-associated phospholipid phosphatase
MPIVTLFLLQKKGVISDLDASIREERIMPLFLGVVFAIFGYLLLHIQEAGMLVKGLMFCTITNTLIIIIITRYWKISIHTMGISGLLSVLWIHSKEYPFIMFIILFFVAYSRVILKAHNIPQVTTGSLLGLILTLIQIHFLFVQI